MNGKHYISTEYLDLARLKEIHANDLALELSEQSRRRIIESRRFLEKKLKETDELFYGINTGFGALCNIRISREQTEELQYYLVQSHACGAGDEVPPEIVRLMLLLKIQSLSYGFSGVRLQLVDTLIGLYNAGVTPVIYQQGSLGASGDLAPLAHLSLPLIELGEVDYEGHRQPSAGVMRLLNIQPLVLQAKEGLALLNGTQFSTAYGLWCLFEADRLYKMANLCAALSLDAFDCRLDPFDERLHHIRAHKGQVLTAAAIRQLLADSRIAAGKKDSIQDPYAFRCIPQVHGASWDAMEHVKQVVLTEVNSVTDNPNIFPEEGVILSGGNFHAQPLALALDYLAIALAELGSISERRVYQLLSGLRGLPSFLTPRAGLHSGMMIPQYTAASIASQNKQLCMPASVDTIPSSNGQEDHVSMAANAATKLYKVVQNLERLLAIEWMTAAQALEFRRPARSSSQLEELLTSYRERVPRLEEDRVLSGDIRLTIDFFRKRMT